MDDGDPKGRAEMNIEVPSSASVDNGPHSVTGKEMCSWPEDMD